MVVALIKKRPDIGLLAPREIALGRSFEVVAILDCAASVPVQAIEVRLIGSVVYFTHSQYGRHANNSEFCRAVARVLDAEVELGEGEHQYRARFELPEHLPASYVGREIRIEYAIDVHVDIPWWPDARASFLLRAASTKSPVPSDERRVFVSDLEGPPARRPYVEVSLGSTELVPSETLHGAVALANVASNEYRAVKMALVRVETMEVPLVKHSVHVREAQWTLALESPGENEPSRFSLTLPPYMVPGFEIQGFSVEWFLEVVADVAWARDPKVWIPVQIRARGLAEEGMRRAPLAVGSERLALVWSKVAEQTGLEFAEGVLRGKHGETEIEIRREHRGRKGVFVVGEVVYPDLGIDLRHTEPKAKQPLSGRDATQVEWLCKKLEEPLAERAPDEADDQHMLWELDDAGQRVDRMVSFSTAVQAVAAALEPVRSQIPPPDSMRDQMASWEAAAARLGGVLHRGKMAIVASREEIGLELQTEFHVSGEPARLVLEVRPTMPIDVRHHMDWYADEGEPLPRGDLDLAGPCEGAAAVKVDKQRVQVVLPADPLDLEDAVARLQALLALGRKLSGKMDGYR
jgi:hypothetical protein